MSVLDQLMDNALSPEKQPVELEALDPEAWSAGAVALAGHQTMKRGIGTKVGGAPAAESVNYREAATIDVSRSLQIANDYRSILVSDILEQKYEPPGEGAVADYVLDGGMKNGRISIHVVSEHADAASTWDELASDYVKNNGTFSRLSFDKFSVNSISEPDQERYQIMETFGGNIIFGYGRRPRIMQITGQVLNGRIFVKVGNETRSMDWKNAMQRQYEKHFRLSECIKRHKRIMIKAQDTVYVGYLLAMQNMVSAAQQSVGQVTLTFVVADRDFPEENDDKIPGRRSESGYPITDKTTPEELFPQARYEHYIQNTFDIRSEINHTESLIQKQLEKIADRLQDRPGDDLTQQDITQGGDKFDASNIRASLLRAQMEDIWSDEDRETRIFKSYPDVAIKIHRLLLYDGKPNFLKDTVNRNNSIENQVDFFKQTYGYDPRDRGLPPDAAGQVGGMEVRGSERSSYESIIQKNSERVSQIRLARNKADLLNSLALEAMQYRLRLWKLKQL